MVKATAGGALQASTVLRERTWAMHQRLESHPMSVALLSADLTLVAYARILKTWHACWAQLERLVAEGAPRDVPEDAWPAKRAVLALQDLAYLGHTPVQLHAQEAPAAPSIQGDGAWHGLAYVMQGSGMGGLVIAAHLERLLGLRAGLGASFFHVNAFAPGGAHVKGTKQGWVHWLQWLDDQLAGDAVRQERAVTAANDTFAYIHEVFSFFFQPESGAQQP